MADLGFIKSYIAEYNNVTGTITLTFESDDFAQEVHIRDVGQPLASVGTLSPSENGWIVETEDEFVFIGNVQGQNAVLVRIDNGPGVDPDYYVYSVGNLNLDPVTYQIDNATTSYVYCLLEGTLIPTERGEIPVEKLTSGDKVFDSNGNLVEIRWVGVQTFSPLFSGKEIWPVKISKGALGESSPNRDLYVSQDHAIFLQGLLVCAEALVNGRSITVEKPTDASIKYYGLDLGPATIHPVHNLPVGSLGAVPREYFDNYKEWLDSGHELIDEPLMFPRVKSATQLPEQVKRGISA